MSTQPNILLVTLHDAGRYLGCYGISTARTPQCDRIANAGVLFENAFAVSPKCSPSRSAVVTGRYPHQNGVYSITHGSNAFRLHDGEKRIGRIMAAGGYQTWLLGLQHEHDDPHELGFEHVDVTFSLTKAPAKFRSCLATRDPGKPFYCQIGCPEVHRPWDRGFFPESGAHGVTVPNYLEPGEGTQRELAQLQGILEVVDHAVGALERSLQDAGCLDNTLIVLTTDHGLPFARAKDTLYDAGTGVFLIVKGPGVASGLRHKGLVSQIDLFATLLEAAGMGLPAEAATSQSLWRCLRGAQLEHREEVFTENNYSGGYDPIRAVRTPRYKYICNFEGNTAPSVAVDYAMTPSHIEQGTKFLRSRSPEELYDLQADPDERHNLIGEAACQAIRAELAQRLFTWMEQTEDPLLDGPLWSTAYQRQRERIEQWRTARQTALQS